MTALKEAGHPVPHMHADPVSDYPADHKRTESYAQSFPLPPFVQAANNAPARLPATAQKTLTLQEEGKTRQKGTASLTDHQCSAPTCERWLYLAGNRGTSGMQAGT